MIKNILKKLYGEHKQTKLEIVFKENSLPKIKLDINSNENKASADIANIFKILQSGYIQQILIEQISCAPDRHQMLEKIYNDYSTISKSKKPNNYDSPVIKPLVAFNSKS